MVQAHVGFDPAEDLPGLPEAGQQAAPGLLAEGGVPHQGGGRVELGGGDRREFVTGQRVVEVPQPGDASLDLGGQGCPDAAARPAGRDLRGGSLTSQSRASASASPAPSGQRPGTAGRRAAAGTRRTAARCESQYGVGVLRPGSQREISSRVIVDRPEAVASAAASCDWDQPRSRRSAAIRRPVLMAPSLATIRSPGQR